MEHGREGASRLGQGRPQLCILLAEDSPAPSQDSLGRTGGNVPALPGAPRGSREAVALLRSRVRTLGRFCFLGV